MSVLSTRKMCVVEDTARRWQLIVEWYDFQRGTPVHVSEETCVDVGGSHFVWELKRTYNRISCCYDVSKRVSCRVQGGPLLSEDWIESEMDMLSDGATVMSCIESVCHQLQGVTHGIRGSVIRCFVRLG
jgi:hypothetical protein